jgi:small subunit ribosomal protein S20
MANTKASKKDILRIKRNTLRNQDVKSALKTSIKKAYIAIDEKSETKDSLIKETLKHIDKVQSKGIIHKNTAARKKSKLALASNKA